jgi:dynein heavy chain 1
MFNFFFPFLFPFLLVGILPKDLEEIKNYTRPAQLIQDTLEAVCVMLGADPAKLNWNEVRKKCSSKDFKQSVINFKNSEITEKIEKWINENYLSKLNVNYERVNTNRYDACSHNLLILVSFSFSVIYYYLCFLFVLSRSKACGPLYKWIHANVNYTNIKNKIKPLQEKIQRCGNSVFISFLSLICLLSVRLEEDSLVTSERLIEASSTLEVLEADLLTLTSEYDVLLARSMTIRHEADEVKEKVDRSTALLRNLCSERNRWQQSFNSFEQEMGSLVGNAIIGSAFLVYAGFYDQHYRTCLLNSCRAFLTALNIEFSPTLSLISFFSSDDQRTEWSLNGLPADDLAVENAIMLSNFNR